MILDEVRSKWHSALKCMAVLIRPLGSGELHFIFSKLPQYDYNDVFVFLKEIRTIPLLQARGKNVYESSFVLKPKALCDILKTMSDEELDHLSTLDYNIYVERKDIYYFSKALHEFLTRGTTDYQMLDNQWAKTVRTDYIAEILTYMRMNDDYRSFVANMPSVILSKMFYEDTKSIELFEYTKTISFFDEIYLSNDRLDENLRNDFSDKLIFYTNFVCMEDVKTCAEKIHKNTFYGCTFQALRLQYMKRYADAVKMYQQGLLIHGERIFTDVYVAYMYVQALISDNSSSSLKKLPILLKKYKVFDSIDYIPLRLAICSVLNEDLDVTITLSILNSLSKIGKILMAYTLHHYDVDNNYDEWINDVKNIVANSDYKIIKIEFAQEFDSMERKHNKQMCETELKPTIEKFKKPEPWEIVIDMLMAKSSDSHTSNKLLKRESTRIFYLVSSILCVTPKLQKSKNGITWSKGRNIAIRKFKDGMPEMNELDKRMMSHVKVEYRHWNGTVDYGIYGESAIAELIGCPYVFMEENPDLRIDILEEKPQLIVTKCIEGYRINNNLGTDGLFKRIVVKKETSQLFKIIRLSNRQIEIFSSFDKIKIFPLESKERLTILLENISDQVTILSDLLRGSENIKKKRGSSLITVQLRPIADEISVQFYVKPLENGTLYCNPGKGMEYIATNVNGNPIQVERNLNKEKDNMKKMMSLMEPFEDCVDVHGWLMTTSDCLQLLDLLKDKSDFCCVEWPEGVKFKVSLPALNPLNFHFSVKGMGRWFEIDGEVKINDSVSMKISEMLSRYHQSEGDFIRLDDNEYVALSENIRKRLSILDRLLENVSDRLRLSVFNVSVLEEIKEIGADLQEDETYQNLIHCIADSENREYAIPSNIHADLREYQKDGYQWMAKIAGWGGGACLADDMGLGKTLQAITLMLARGGKGASLVVVPTSLLLNWQDEISKFAPTLTPLILNNAGDDRKKLIDEAGNYDVIITTYGLLVSEENIVCSSKWNMVVLDEAHTIKNRETKMSKSAMKLKADFRLILTGTPLQNHLSEIWNLFQFANPGLLGSFQQFTTKYIIPIEKEHDKDQQRLLNRILSPFILRRTKSEVLSELPEKTEVTMKVEMSDEEWAFYENVRQQALLNLKEKSNTTIQALAEITKLRQIACNSALVDATLNIASSKMEMLMELVDDLIENRHRALIFSQFTSHLALIREKLDEKGVKYLYLDGQMTATKRVEKVKEFQNGDMPLFLISLKAGGLGLNLTAADYIIHMDPWWNPAIEEQASDRAYRIGQKRPVTVYRLISKGTIEEKIIQLHQKKKDLADALLDGSDMTQKMNREELLSLLMEQV
jgi:superfamily II DNA or RNA helicase